jgi:hypothetical protein
MGNARASSVAAGDWEPGGAMVTLLWGGDLREAMMKVGRDVRSSEV